MRRFIYEMSATNIRDWSLAYSFISINNNKPWQTIEPSTEFLVHLAALFWAQTKFERFEQHQKVAVCVSTFNLEFCCFQVDRLAADMVGILLNCVNEISFYGGLGGEGRNGGGTHNRVVCTL